MTTLATSDWRSEFRLHTMDLGGATTSAQGSGGGHWMLQNQAICAWLRDVAQEYDKLIALGGDPFDGHPMTPEAVIAKLGFTDRQKPSGFFEAAKFTAALVAATTREATGAQREVIRLRRRLRNGRGQ